MMKRWRWLPLFMAGVLAVTLACGEDEPTTPDPPGTPTIQVTTVADTITVTWTAVTGATAYRAELRTNPDTLRQSLVASATEAVFTSADGVVDDVTYTAVVFAVNLGGETASTSDPQVLTNFFPWDEYYETSLHATGQGKKTFYDLSPNNGFERYTAVAYNNLDCKNCHEPASTGGCASCHETDTPTFGATVDASLTGACGACHGRQKAEAIEKGYSDVHRDAATPMGCMDCHSSGDVHGDGTAYASMLDDGAIDSRCEDCHASVPTNTYHSIHSSSVDCSACHMQSVVSCYNCHFEAEIAGQGKIAYAKFSDWVFLMNFRGKVHPANFQSVKYGNNTFVVMAPFYAHTIARNAVSGCDDCHGNTAVKQYAANGSIDVVTWDAAQEKLIAAKGRIPVPPDFLTAMNFDFVTLDSLVSGTKYWSFLKQGADTIQIVYGSALTADQMTKLQ